jgi:Protein of unknown function (DUF1403)
MTPEAAGGAALLGLDQLIRSEPVWLGCWRMRLAMRATLTSARLLRLTADEASLRDAEYLTRPGDDPGPAGRIYRQWRAFATRPIAQAEEIARTADIETAALMHADIALAAELGWRVPLPLIATAIHAPALRSGEAGKRPSPLGSDWPERRHAVVAHAAMEAHALALPLARKAEALAAAAGTLRTREAANGLSLILADDAVAPWQMVGRNKHGSDRAARRFCDSLQELGALRLLTDRAVFRLYGI